MRFYRDLVECSTRPSRQKATEATARYSFQQARRWKSLKQTITSCAIARTSGGSKPHLLACRGGDPAGGTTPPLKLPEPSSIATRMAARLCCAFRVRGCNQGASPQESTSSAGLKCSTAPLHDGDDAQAAADTAAHNEQPTAHTAGGTEVPARIRLKARVELTLTCSTTP